MIKMQKIPRWIQLYEDESLPSNSGTKLYSIDQSNQILELQLAMRATNGATRNFADNVTFQDIWEALTLVEINEGSHIYKSMTSEIAAYIAAYNSGRHPPEIATMAGGAEQEATIPLTFGCFPGDPEVLLPAPILEGSLNLNLKWDFTESATAGFASSDFEFDLHALVIPPESEEVMKRKRVLVTRKKHDHTTTASGDHAFSMSKISNAELRRIYVHCYEAGIAEGVDITKLKLEANTQPIYDAIWKNLQYKNARDCRLNFARKVQVAGAASDVWITRIPKVAPQYSSNVAAGADYIASITADGITFPAQAPTGWMELNSEVIPAMAIIDFDLANDQQNLVNIDPTQMKELFLLATQGAAGGTVQVLEEHLRKFW